MRLVSVGEAVDLVDDEATVLIVGAGGGLVVPQLFIDKLAETYKSTGRPKGLTTVRVVGIGDWGDRGFSQLALPGLMKRTIGSNIGNEPRLGELVRKNELESYSLPQGVLAQLVREIAGGRPGLVTRTGLHTFVDPRQTGGKQNSSTTEDLIEVVQLRDDEYLFYHTFPIDVAVIRATTADEDGNLTMEDEVFEGEMLASAMAAHNCGGIVIAQVKQVAARCTLRARDVRVPGALVDYVYTDPAQRQTYVTSYSPYYSGALRRPASATADVRLDIRKIIARRALLEFQPGDIVNLGFGISMGIGAVAWEEGIADKLALTVEVGVFGGAPASGEDGGAGSNYQAIIDQPAMFDFYDGGGLDIASLSFAEVDQSGNVNVHSFAGRLRGPGGFPNISARTKRLCFVGALEGGGLEIELSGGAVRIRRNGSIPKFVPRVQQITFNGQLALENGQDVRFITERAVFSLTPQGVTLTEIAPGIDIERDVIGRMGFEPRVQEPLKTMDSRIFRKDLMGLGEEFHARDGSGNE